MGKNVDPEKARKKRIRRLIILALLVVIGLNFDDLLNHVGLKILRIGKKNHQFYEKHMEVTPYILTNKQISEVFLDPETPPVQKSYEQWKDQDVSLVFRVKNAGECVFRGDLLWKYKNHSHWRTFHIDALWNPSRYIKDGWSKYNFQTIHYFVLPNLMLDIEHSFNVMYPVDPNDFQWRWINIDLGGK